jgi:hypothetical protein
LAGISILGWLFCFFFTQGKSFHATVVLRNQITVLIGFDPFPPLFQNGRNISEKNRVDFTALNYELSHQTPLVGGSTCS